MQLVIYIFGNIALVSSIIGLLPQICKVYKTKSAKDISLIMLINYVICAISWTIYGIATKSTFVIYSNIVNFIMSIFSIFQKLYYDKKIFK